MKIFYSFFILIILCSVCAAQNTDDASKYTSNPRAALSDAQDALKQKNYERAKKLAIIYNALSNSDKGNVVIKEADVHLNYSDIINEARKDYTTGDYYEALKKFIYANDILKAEDGLYTSIESCCIAILDKKIEMPSDTAIGHKLYNLYQEADMTSSNSAVLLQIASLCGNGIAAQEVGYIFKNKEKYEEAVRYLEIAKSKGHNVYADLGYSYNMLSSTDRKKRDEYLQSSFENYLESAKRGNRVSQYNVGMYYEDGTGTKKDIKEARLWYNKSYSNGFEKAKTKFDAVNEKIKNDSIRHIVINSTKSNNEKKKWYEKMNWDLDPDDSYLGIRYSNSKNIPFGLSLIKNYEIGYSYIGEFRIEGGFIISPYVYSYEKQIESEGKIIGSELSMYLPNYYMTVAPGLLFRFFSFDIGIGAMYSSREYYEKIVYPVISNYQSGSTSMSTIITTSDNIYTIGDKSFSENKTIINTSSDFGRYHFMLQPTFALMLPLFDDVIILSTNVGYNYIVDSPEISNWTFGVGVLFNLDY